MDLQTIYPGAIPLETDLLNTNKNVLVALGKLASAVFGTSTMVNGLSVVANSPAALNVVVNPGEIYSLQNLLGTAYSSLAADTTHQIMKQGIMLDAVTLSTPAPATAGQSINYLIQATYQDSDTGNTVLPYYNASNPSQAYSGPANSGTAQPTVRKGTVVVSAKAGVAATTGSQTTPAADAGYVGLYVVTVANGQASVTAANISAVANAPFINSSLHGLSPVFNVSPVIPAASSANQAMQLGQATGRLLNVQIFTGNGTYTPTAGMSTAIVKAVGGGGAGGGTAATGASTYAAAGGGASGSYGEGRYTAAQIGASQTITIGAGGASGGAGASGGSGGTTSFGTLMSCPGGGGCAASGAATAPFSSSFGAIGAAPTGANIVSAQGAPGGVAVVLGGGGALSGPGAGSPLLGGGGGGPAMTAGSNGTAANGYGAGGSGSCGAVSDIARAGAAGKGGIVIVWEFA